ncbi:hypothetical protein FEM03_00060 [Phragmitibacter flavus]|uniref:PEP-CTERM sorting domain-containing protein n=1 Tax=Phragmitibacter flavus TaxID=2576071 RepID=A0A5R8KJK7_9BACT|nr:hypothetical protein [Phragmitibacter flavus]TLD72508.1 hypothetical protein FEM03_00060 [Phragmitibacter flavus]
MKLAATLLALSTVAIVSSASSQQIVETVDFAPLEGTAWGSRDLTVRVNFGEGIGLGTLTFTGINGGFFAVPNADYKGETLAGYDLENGSVLNRTEEVTFSIRSDAPPPVGELMGFNLTVTLDSGVFPTGSVFLTRSLDWTPDFRQYLELDQGLGSPTNANLPTDFGNTVFSRPLVEISPGLFSVTELDTYSLGKAFPILGNGFSVNFLTTASSRAGLAFSIAVAPVAAVPEPSAALLVLSGLGLLILGPRRRRIP